MLNIRYLITPLVAILSHPFLIVNEFKNCLKEERIHDPRRRVLLPLSNTSDPTACRLTRQLWPARHPDLDF